MAFGWISGIPAADTLAAMRETLPLGLLPFRTQALRDEEVFLYRRVADRNRCVLAVGEVEAAEAPRFDAGGVADDWWFGHAAYGWKDALEPLRSRHADRLAWPLTRWFRPRWVVEWHAEEARLHVRPGDTKAALAFVERMRSASADATMVRIDWHLATTSARYSSIATGILAHIQRGDCYELNYCIERQASGIGFDPFAGFARLEERSQAPFAAFYRLGHRFALCASPERFLSFEGMRVTAEPMKGTRPRGRSMAEDAALMEDLARDAKERSENIMAVDVMRNDLSRTAAPASVRVQELCTIRSYPRVHQMVSTVVSQRAADRSPWDVVRAAFPMASMTGAPKIRAMQLIDEAEEQARGLYSGTLGFFAPDGTGDLNVVIRTVMLDARDQELSLHTGSAITARCQPDAEWKECGLKAESVINALAYA